MKKILALCLLIPAMAYSFTYRNNPQTGKPDLVTTSVADLVDYGTGYVTTSRFNIYSSATQTKLDGKQPLLGYTPMKTDYSNAGTAPTWNQNTTGSAATLTTARTINGVSFNGSANIQTATANTSDYATTTFTPAFTGLTVVAGTGSVTPTGTYTKIGKLVCWQVQLVPSGTCTAQSVIGSTYFTLPTAPNTSYAWPFSAAQFYNTGSLASGVIDLDGNAYPSSWTASATNRVTMSGCYQTP